MVRRWRGTSDAELIRRFGPAEIAAAAISLFVSASHTTQLLDLRDCAIFSVFFHRQIESKLYGVFHSRRIETDRR